MMNVLDWIARMNEFFDISSQTVALVFTTILRVAQNVGGYSNLEASNMMAAALCLMSKVGERFIVGLPDLVSLSGLNIDEHSVVRAEEYILSILNFRICFHTAVDFALVYLYWIDPTNNNFNDLHPELVAITEYVSEIALRVTNFHYERPSEVAVVVAVYSNWLAKKGDGGIHTMTDFLAINKSLPEHFVKTVLSQPEKMHEAFVALWETHSNLNNSFPGVYSRYAVRTRRFVSIHRGADTINFRMLVNRFLVGK